ncbi:DMT family transporter [Candidatus Kaiserbacteria bacterium]|nr:DMT family transporter [Candidatus Kaiserbacteria bacterium]
MDQATLLWTLAGTVFAGIALFTQKIAAEEGRSAAFYGMLSYGTSGFFGIILLFFLTELPEQWLLIGIFGLAAGLIHGFANFVRIESLKYIDSVIFFPLNKLFGPLIVVIGAVWFFRESLTFIQYTGVALSLVVPLLLISSAEHHRQKDLMRGLRLLAISTFLSGLAILVTKQGFAYGTSVVLLLSTSQIAGTVASASILLRQHGAGMRMISHAGKRDVQLGIWSGVISFVSSYCLFEAMSTGYVSLVYVIQAHYILIPIVLSVWWYKDHINFRKFAAVVVSFFAIALIAV